MEAITYKLSVLWNSQPVEHSDQVSERGCGHLKHDLTAMDFDRHFADSKPVGDLLVDHAGYD